MNDVELNISIKLYKRSFKMKKILKCFFVLTIIVSVWYSSEFFVSAAPYFNKVFEFKQPDNSKVQVVVSGDEYYQEIEGLNGYTLCRDSKGWICYAKLNQDGTQYTSDGQVYKSGKDVVKGGISKHIRISNESVSKIRQATMKSLQSNSAGSSYLPQNTIKTSGGTDQKYINSSSDSVDSKDLVNGITILIDFPDQKSDISKDEIDNFFNQTGYTGFNNNGSVKDYFYDVSGGKMIYRNMVVGFYTAKYPKAHYDNPNLDEETCGSELGEEALKWLISSNIDLSSLTVDSSGCVKGLNFLYAGSPDSGWSKGLWPHKSWLKTLIEYKGISFAGYEMTNIGNDLSLGIICHENGHLICGYPDLYDYNNNSAGCGQYSLMANYSDIKNPVPPDPYCRNIISKWNTTINLNDYNNNSVVYAKSNSNGAQDVYKWSKNGSSTEYFLIENIQAVGRYASFNDQGLMIWHIDETGDNSCNQMTADRHYMVSVVQADDKFELEKYLNGGDVGDLFHAGYASKFNDNTLPNAKWWDGTDSGLDVSDISETGETMKFIKTKTYDSSVKYGDVNGDGKIDVCDYLLINKYISKKIAKFPSSNGMKAADVNGDNLIDLNDYILVRKYIIHNINKFPIQVQGELLNSTS